MSPFLQHEMKKSEKSAKVFHGCFRIIEKHKRCVYPTSQPIWKQTEDILAGVRTRSQEQNQTLVKRGDFNRYLRQKGRNNIKEWLVTDVSELLFSEGSDSFFVGQ